MANCIDREAFKSKYLCCGYLPEMSEAEFDSFPAADVAPVVLCRDCKHGYRVYENGDDYGCWMMLALPRWCKGDHFCAYGERKDGGG